MTGYGSASTRLQAATPGAGTTRRTGADARWRRAPFAIGSAEFKRAWQALNERYLSAHPLGDLNFVQPLLAHFGSNDLECLVRQGGHGPSAMLLVRQQKPGVMACFCPSQSELGLVLLDDFDDLRGIFTCLPRSVMALNLHRLDPGYNALPAAGSPLVSEIKQHATTVSIDLDRTMADYWQSRPRKLRRNIEVARRRLEADGRHWRFAARESPGDMRAAVERYGELESRGWKRQAGTAVHPDNMQGAFYAKLMQKFATRGKAVVYELYVDDQLAASQLAIASDSLMITLKTTHDEGLRRYSPGRLLDYLTIRHEFERARFRRIEFCTNACALLARWGTESRPVFDVTLYRNRAALYVARLARALGPARQGDRGDRESSAGVERDAG
jgi:hypothetical protein